MDGCLENDPERTTDSPCNVLDPMASSSLAIQHGPQLNSISVDTHNNIRRERSYSWTNWARKRRYTHLQTHQHVDNLAHSLGKQSLGTNSGMASSPAPSLVPLSSLLFQDSVANQPASMTMPYSESTAPSAIAADNWANPSNHGSRLEPDTTDVGSTQSSWYQTGSHEKVIPQYSTTQIFNPVIEVDTTIEVDDKILDMDEGYFDKAQQDIDEAMFLLATYRKSGRLPYRSSKEVAMNCPHAIRNQPRMRRRKQKAEKRHHHTPSGSSRTASQSSMSDAAGPPPLAIPLGT